MICFNDAFWLCISNKTKNLGHSMPILILARRHVRKSLSLIFIHVLLHPSRFFCYLYEVGLQSIQSSFVAYEHSYLLFYSNYVSSAPVTGSLEIFNLWSKLNLNNDMTKRVKMINRENKMVKNWGVCWFVHMVTLVLLKTFN